MCFTSAISNNCFKGLFKTLFSYLVRVGTRCNRIFPNFLRFDPCAVANLLKVFEGDNLGCSV